MNEVTTKLDKPVEDQTPSAGKPTHTSPPKTEEIGKEHKGKKVFEDLHSHHM